MINNYSEDDAWCYWLVTVGALFSFVGFLLACICSCRRHENKSEFLGLAGMVTITNHAESQEFDRQPTTTDIVQTVAQDTADGGKRVTGANRSLPDIPKDKNVERESEIESAPREIIYDATETMGDPSELYATVQDKNVDKNRDFDGEAANGSNDRETLSILADGVYPYARLDTLESSNGKSNDEHPYAQVQNIQKTEYCQQNRNNAAAQFTDNNQPSTSTSHASAVGNPVAPPRTRRSSSHNSLLGGSGETTSDNIQAANAITGSVQANQDLPYMTPPILLPLPRPPGQSQQNLPHQHFSGDSQDSKGYTSISVREPLANIIAQTKGLHQHRQGARALIDPHYATVSDDSDEMYAAIDEQDKVYTSGSETYAQIQPMTCEIDRTTVQVEQQIPSQVPLRSCADDSSGVSSAPQPPSVDSLRYVAHAHSRQASSSSATSSIANPSSPKPEKRQANSPLPPPPPAPTEAGSEDFYASVEKRGRNDDRTRSSISSGKSLEDMYAKVIKKKQQQQQQQQHDVDDAVFDIPSNSVTTLTNNSGEFSSSRADPPNARKLSLVEASRASWSSHDSVEIQKREDNQQQHTSNHNSSDVANSERREDAEYEKIARTYELDSRSLDRPSTENNEDYGYEPLANNNRGETRQRMKTCQANSSADDPNYEMLRPQAYSGGATTRSNVTNVGRNGIDVMPIYSLPLKHRQVSNASSQDPGYERVGLRRRDADPDTDSEPNYESMPHDVGEPNYASVCRPGDSDTDPNYESVAHGDPNYESVRYASVNRKIDPPYERVVDNYRQQQQQQEEIRSDDPSMGYESVKCNHESIDPNYEKIHLAYREIVYSCDSGDTDDEQYVQV